VLCRHVDALPPVLREVVYLFSIEEYATDEIAAIVGVAPATVRTRLHRARARLRKMLREEER
jgi:RNA polymerase sigma-70 factor (ECF subfamily)